MFYVLFGIFIVFTVGLTCFMVKMHTIYNYWKNKNVYTRKPHFLFGNSKDVVLQKIPLGFDVTALYNDLKGRSEKFGGYYNFFTPVFVPVDLDLIKKILISHSDHFLNRVSHVDEENDPLSANLVHGRNEQWKKLRSKTSSSFSTSKVKKFLPIIMEQINNLEKLIEETIQKQESLNIKEILDRYMIDVIGLFTCSTNFNTMKYKNSDIQRQLTDFFNTSFIDSLIRFLITAPKILKIFKIKTFNKKVTKFYFALIDNIISHRKIDEIKAITVLDKLVQCESEKTSDKAQNITRSEVVANIAVFFLAGYETSSNALTFCLYELASNLKIQEILRSEVLSLSKNPSYDEIASLSFLNKCINETLRKYPLGTISSRECTKTFRVPDTDLILEKGSHVYLPVRGIHWDAEYYPNPERFDPERFSEEHINERHSCAWLAFGYGPRQCVGYRLGILTMKVVLIRLLQNYQFSLNCQTPLSLQYNVNAYVLQSESSILLNVKKLTV